MWIVEIGQRRDGELREDLRAEDLRRRRIHIEGLAVGADHDDADRELLQQLEEAAVIRSGRAGQVG